MPSLRFVQMCNFYSKQFIYKYLSIYENLKINIYRYILNYNWRGSALFVFIRIQLPETSVTDMTNFATQAKMPY